MGIYERLFDGIVNERREWNVCVVTSVTQKQYYVHQFTTLC